MKNLIEGMVLIWGKGQLQPTCLLEFVDFVRVDGFFCKFSPVYLLTLLLLFFYLLVKV